MKLKRLEISNIRTYNEAVIEFQDGITLFEGDIGSGKSTILTAIEFALFGLGNLSGGDVLRLDQQKGHVTLTFEVENKTYSIYRELINSKGKIKQENTYIETPEGRIPLSATDLKSKVLEVLNFKESASPKAHSVIFRYAIYTPQEEMKLILTEDPASRLETLRKAFSVEDYKTAKDNVSELQRDIRVELKILKEKISEEEEIKEESEKLGIDIHQKEEAKKKMHADYTKTDKEIQKIKKQIDEQNAKKDLIFQKTEALKQQASQIAEVKKDIDVLKKANLENISEIRYKEQEIGAMNKKFETVNSEVLTLTKEIEILKKSKKPDYDEILLKGKISSNEKEVSSLNMELGGINNEIFSFEKLIKNKKCPTCQQDTSSKEFNSKLEIKTKEEEIIQKKKILLEKERDDLNKQLDAVREFKRIEEEIIGKLNLIKSKSAQKEAVETNKRNLSAIIEKVKKSILDNEAKIAEKEIKLKQLPEITKIKEAAEKELDETQQIIFNMKKEEDKFQTTSKNIHGDIKSLETQIENSKVTIQRNLEKIKEIEKLKKTRETYELFVQWLEDYFIGALDAIERHVLSNINQRFNVLFSIWFRKLLENSDLNVEIDEAFTPLITQGDWSQTITSLSGGEKTSVALAYRLALNSTIREIFTIDSYSLMILDEPTDGFSKEQLPKVQEVLREIGCNQIILVSHETELEGCADQTYRIEKRGRVSKITKK